MSDDTFPHPISDPEAEGLPGVADDSSDVATGRIADGPDPAGPGGGASAEELAVHPVPDR